ncbi:MAG: type II toxin-antitoxin system Phd/YefM family antitoxin [Pseudonocardiaceae bacterium]
MQTVGVRDLVNRASALLDELEQGGQPIIVTRRRQPIAVLSTIDAEESHDYVLAHAPEFVRGRKEADDAISRGELGVPLADVLAELDAEDRGDRRST